MTLLKKILGADNGEEEMEGLSIGDRNKEEEMKQLREEMIKREKAHKKINK